MLKAKTTKLRVSEGKSDAIKEVTREKTRRLNANIPESLYRDLQLRATQEGRKLNDLVIEWVNEYLSKYSNE